MICDEAILEVILVSAGGSLVLVGGYLCIGEMQISAWQILLQEGLFADAAAFRDANIVDVASYDELRRAIEEGKWARGPWAGNNDQAMRCMTCCMPGRLLSR